MVIVKHGVEAWAFCLTCGWANELQGGANTPADILERMLTRMTGHRASMQNNDHEMKVELVKVTYDNNGETENSEKVFWLASTERDNFTTGFSWYVPTGIQAPED